MLTRTVMVQVSKRGKKLEKVQLPPPETLVYGVALTLVFFAGLVVLEIVHMVVFHKWNDAVWNAISLIVGVLIGAFFTGGRR